MKEPNVGDIWMISGANCYDLVLVTAPGEGYSLDCSSYPGGGGKMLFNETHLIRRIQEA